LMLRIFLTIVISIALTPQRANGSRTPERMNAEAAKTAKLSSASERESRGGGHRRAAGAAGRQTQAVRVRERMACDPGPFVPGPESACVRRFAMQSMTATAAPLRPQRPLRSSHFLSSLFSVARGHLVLCAV